MLRISGGNTKLLWRNLVRGYKRVGCYEVGWWDSRPLCTTSALPPLTDTQAQSTPTHSLSAEGPSLKDFIHRDKVSLSNQTASVEPVPYINDTAFSANNRRGKCSTDFRDMIICVDYLCGAELGLKLPVCDEIGAAAIRRSFRIFIVFLIVIKFSHMIKASDCNVK